MPPISAYLEHDRLRHREARMVRALTVLEARIDILENNGLSVPPALASAVTGFRRELDATRARLP